MTKKTNASDEEYGGRKNEDFKQQIKEIEMRKEQVPYKCITDRKDDQINKRPYCLLCCLLWFFPPSDYGMVMPNETKTTESKM